MKLWVKNHFEPKLRNFNQEIIPKSTLPRSLDPSVSMTEQNHLVSLFFEPEMEHTSYNGSVVGNQSVC